MGLSAYQQCRSLNGWVPIEVPSQSDPEKRYLVLVNPWDTIDENICECRGYEFRGHCAHQKIAKQLLCGWDEMAVRSISQTPGEQKLMICPKCKGSTMWAFRPDEENEENDESD